MSEYTVSINGKTIKTVESSVIDVTEDDAEGWRKLAEGPRYDLWLTKPCLLKKGDKAVVSYDDGTEVPLVVLGVQDGGTLVHARRDATVSPDPREGR